MDIGNTDGEAADRGGVGFHIPQRIGRQEAATKIGEGSMDLKVDMAAGRS